MNEKPQKQPVRPGLEDVVAATTRLSRVDGLAGELLIGGFPVEALAPHISFEETLHLLWYDRLPEEGELRALKEALSAGRGLSRPAMTLLRTAAAAEITPMDALQMAAATLSLSQKGATAEEQALAAVAAFPTLVAAYQRLRAGESPIPAHPDLGHAANFLYMLNGEEPGDERIRGLETYLNTVVDHGLNASTFAARVIISTGSDMVSALLGAVGALKGPLHGGAPGPALDMVFQIGEAGNAEPFIRAKLEAGERLMGFGHRVYKVRDPRAEVLSRAAARFYRADGDMALFQLAKVVEDTAVRLLARFKPGRRLQTNVEYYTALLLHGLGLPTELFTPTFAISRVAGWTAHCFEQIATGKLIRPRAEYVGERREGPILKARI